MKWVCHKSVKKRNTRVCTCDHSCTASKYGKCVYTHPDKNFCFYPCVPRNTETWDDLYHHRVQIERTIHIFMGFPCFRCSQTPFFCILKAIFIPIFLAFSVPFSLMPCMSFASSNLLGECSLNFAIGYVIY